MGDTRARSTSTVASAAKARNRGPSHVDDAGRSRSMSLQASSASAGAATTNNSKNNSKSGSSGSSNGSDGESLGATLEPQRPASASPVSEESAIMYTSPSKHLKARKGPTSRMHKLFPELADEIVLDDFSCALQKDILVHGRLFVSERHFCFHANIFGWVTKLVIDCKDVLHLRKEKTALIIPNAIKLETTTKSYTFASFIARDTAYRCLFKVWQNALLDEPLSAEELLRSSVKGWHDNIGDESFMHSPSTEHLIDSVRRPRRLHVVDARGSRRSSTEALHRVGRSISSGADDDEEEDEDEEEEEDVDDIVDDVADDGHGSAFVAEEEFEGRAGGGHEEVVAGSLKVGDKGAALVEAQDVPVVSVEEAGEGAAVVEADGRGARRGTKSGRSSSSRGSTRSGKSTTASSVSAEPVVTAAAATVTTTTTHSKKGRKKHKKGGIKGGRRSSHHTRTVSVATTHSAELEEAPATPPLSCDFGTMFLDVELPCSVDEAAQMLFSYSPMFKELYKKRKTTNVDISEWAVGEDGKRARDLGYTLALDYSFGPRTTRGEEHQIEAVPHVAGQYWIVDGDVFTPHVPYGDNFYTKTRTVISRLAPARCRVQVCTETHYRKKRPWSITRQLIESNSTTGLKKYYTLVRQLLLKHAKLAHDSHRASRAPSRGSSLKDKGADTAAAAAAAVASVAAAAGDETRGDGVVIEEVEGAEDVSRSTSVASEEEEGDEEEEEEEDEEEEAVLAEAIRESEEVAADDKMAMLGQLGLLKTARRLLRDEKMLLRAWRRYRITILSFLVWTLLVLMGYHLLMGDTAAAPEPLPHTFGREGAGAAGDLRSALPLSSRAQGALSRVSAALRVISEEARVLAEEVEAVQRHAAGAGGSAGGDEKGD